MCCSGPTWKREVVPDHKFDFVDVREFSDNGCGMRFKYLFLYLIILKSFLVYVSDIFTAVTMLSTDSWSNDIYNKCPKDDPAGCIPVDFAIGKWVFFGCIIFGFLLLAYETRKSKRIIASRDISYAFTNILANNYYSLRSYDHFCFFDHISNSTKRKDDFAFFVFFAFKDWKRLILSDGPRQSINAITLYSFYLSCQKPDDPNDSWDNFSKYFDGRDLISNILICVMLFTVLVFAVSLLVLIVAAVCYVPLLCYVQGNLKEYCCHKVDKRIAEIIKRRNRQRQQKAAALARKEAAGDYSHLKGKNGAPAGAPLPQPTLPNVALDDDEFSDVASFRTRATGTTGAPPAPYAPQPGAPDTYGYPPDAKYSPSEYAAAGPGGAGAGEYGAEYPPMPAYPYGTGYGAPTPAHGGPPDYSNPSLIYGEREPYFNDYGSTSHLPLAGSAAPVAGAGADYAMHPPAGRPPSDPLDVSAGPGAYTRESDGSAGLAYMRDSDGAGAGLAYEQDYPSPTSAGPPPRGQEHSFQAFHQPPQWEEHAPYGQHQPPQLQQYGQQPPAQQQMYGQQQHAHEQNGHEQHGQYGGGYAH